MTSLAVGDDVSQAFVDVLVRSPALPTKPTSDGFILGLFLSIIASHSCSNMNCEMRKTCGLMDRVVMTEA